MGSFLAKAQLKGEVQKYQFAQTKDVLAKNHKFEDLQEGFGFAITKELYKKIFKPDKKTFDKEWAVWDKENAGTVDVLQVFASYIIISAGTFQEKLQALYTLFDFDEDNSLNISEMTVLVVSSITGLAKLCGLKAPPKKQLEGVGRKVFEKADAANTKLIKDGQVDREELKRFVLDSKDAIHVMCLFGTADRDGVLEAYEKRAEKKKKKKSKPTKEESKTSSFRKKVAKPASTFNTRKKKIPLAKAQTLKKIFDSMDADGSGELSVAELKDIFSNDPIHSSSDDFIKLLDHDGDGNMTFQELLVFLYPGCDEDHVREVLESFAPLIVTQEDVAHLAYEFLCLSVDVANSMCQLNDIVDRIENDPIYRRYLNAIPPQKRKSTENLDFQAFLSLCLSETHRDQMTQIFDWSTNTDLRLLPAAQMTELRNMFRLYDTEDKGVIYVPDMRKKLKENAAPDAEKMLAQLDLDGDNEVTFKEFVRYYRKACDPSDPSK